MIEKADPKYRRQSAKPYDRAFVELCGQRVYLGRHGSSESRQQYHRALQEFHANGERLAVCPEHITVVEVVDVYLKHCQDRYAESKARHRIKMAVKPLTQLYGRTRAKEFGPARLRVVRETWINSKLALTTINERVATIVRLFTWAASHELIPPEVYWGLASLEHLQRGRSKAKDPKIVGPVSSKHVAAIRPFLSRQVRALVDLQRLVGARSSEILSLKIIDLDVTDPIWSYQPAQHKNRWRGTR
ncbi:MAG: hypothetical protein IID41_04000 [Planctomycetes bacterium]|nr:hypothetical protein [Planctomycetota bacterium]